MYRNQERDIPSRLQVVATPAPAPNLVDEAMPTDHGRAAPAPTPRSEPAALAPTPMQPNPAETAAKTPQRRSRRKIALGALLAVAVAVAGWFGYDWWTVGRFTVSTDDAYVQAYNTTWPLRSRAISPASS